MKTKWESHRMRTRKSKQLLRRAQLDFMKNKFRQSEIVPAPIGVDEKLVRASNNIEMRDIRIFDELDRKLTRNRFHANASAYGIPRCKKCKGDYRYCECE
jgi:hypothetical protein